MLASTSPQRGQDKNFRLQVYDIPDADLQQNMHGPKGHTRSAEVGAINMALTWASSG